ncbi:hypothetical protein, partial [Microcystis sp.]|uniref:hypothetical protein n=1 Tax=Microcystis sp. TaxID=1127 RepID=UPI00391F3DFD
IFNKDSDEQFISAKAFKNPKGCNKKNNTPITKRSLLKGCFLKIFFGIVSFSGEFKFYSDKYPSHVTQGYFDEMKAIQPTSNQNFNLV